MVNLFRRTPSNSTKDIELETPAGAASRPGTRTPPRRPEAPAATTDGNGLREEIERRAYFKWREAGCPDGQGDRFWLEAEREVLEERQ